MSTHSICLLGRDYPDLGPLALSSLPVGGAIALSRGALPKAYAHVDPNEDGALLAHTAHGSLLAVADGYNGVFASEVALACARENASRLVSASERVFCDAVGEVVSEVNERLKRSGRTRTCLILVSVRAQHVNVACFGDSSVFRSSLSDPVTFSNDLVLGSRAFERGMPTDRWFGHFKRDPGEVVAAVSDGVTNFISDPSMIREILQAAPDDPSAARAIALAAMAGGAGDNIAVATLANPDHG
ncbi:MAG: hypothetical protein GY725_21535 [bacterium]|nr:hypothetical protein [bacterium]